MFKTTTWIIVFDLVYTNCEYFWKYFAVWLGTQDLYLSQNDWNQTSSAYLSEYIINNDNQKYTKKMKQTRLLYKKAQDVE